jgi:hypothetical protein
VIGGFLLYFLVFYSGVYVGVQKDIQTVKNLKAFMKTAQDVFTSGNPTSYELKIEKLNYRPDHKWRLHLSPADKPELEVPTYFRMTVLFIPGDPEKAYDYKNVHFREDMIFFAEMNPADVLAETLAKEEGWKHCPYDKMAKKLAKVIKAFNESKDFYNKEQLSKAYLALKEAREVWEQLLEKGCETPIFSKAAQKSIPITARIGEAWIPLSNKTFLYNPELPLDLVILTITQPANTEKVFLDLGAVHVGWIISRYVTATPELKIIFNPIANTKEAQALIKNITRHMPNTKNFEPKTTFAICDGKEILSCEEPCERDDFLYFIEENFPEIPLQPCEIKLKENHRLIIISDECSKKLADERKALCVKPPEPIEVEPDDGDREDGDKDEPKDGDKRDDNGEKEPICGNGIVEEREECDGDVACSEIKGPGWTGKAYCIECKEIDTTGCIPPCKFNGVIYEHGDVREEKRVGCVTIKDVCQNGNWVEIEIPDEPRLCPEQDGVCKGTTQKCNVTTRAWTHCDYEENSKQYGNGKVVYVEEEEGYKWCHDGLDNDCDGYCDDIFLPDCPKGPESKCK